MQLSQISESKCRSEEPKPMHTKLVQPVGQKALMQCGSGVESGEWELGIGRVKGNMGDNFSSIFSSGAHGVCM